MNITNSSTIAKNFDELFLTRPSKIASGIASTILTFLETVLTFGIVWYERFGHDQTRTLVNKLTSKAFLMGAICSLHIYFTEIYRFFVGKKNHIFFSKNAFWRRVLDVKVEYWQKARKLTSTLLKFTDFFLLKNYIWKNLLKLTSEF